MEWFDLTVVTGSLPEFWRGLWMTLHLTGIALSSVSALPFRCRSLECRRTPG
jgi:hypothetical protein